MKRCPLCGEEYSDDTLTICHFDGIVLEAVPNAPPQSGQPPLPSKPKAVLQQGAHQADAPLVSRGFLYYSIEGIVAEVLPQQYYPTTFSKVLRSLFGGEPFQFGHTSFATIVRVAERRDVGFPEQACDVRQYGNVENIIAPGDDVQISAKRKHGGFVAKSIYNHSADTYVHLQGMIPAGVIRLLTALALLLLIAAADLLLQIDYIALIQNFFRWILQVINPLIPIALTVVIVFILIKSIFKPR